MQLAAELPLGDQLSGTVDLDRYPIHAPDSSAYRDTVERIRRELDDDGCSIINSFFREDTIQRVQDEAVGLLPSAHINNIQSNPYSTSDDPTLPERHPVRLFMERTNAFVPRDRIPADNALHSLYQNQTFQRFVADCVEVETIHEYADPLAGFVFNLLQPGCQHPWHYDANEFIVSALVQPGEQGGVFEYCPKIRRPGDESYDQVASVILDEDRSPVKQLSIRVGDLQLFKGRFALHRVTRVHGAVPRISAIFAYAERPNFISSVERAEQLFGRSTELHRQMQGKRRSHDGLMD